MKNKKFIYPVIYAILAVLLFVVNRQVAYRVILQADSVAETQAITIRIAFYGAILALVLPIFVLVILKPLWYRYRLLKALYVSQIVVSLATILLLRVQLLAIQQIVASRLPIFYVLALTLIMLGHLIGLALSIAILASPSYSKPVKIGFAALMAISLYRLVTTGIIGTFVLQAVGGSLETFLEVVPRLVAILTLTVNAYVLHQLFREEEFYEQLRIDEPSGL